MKIIINHNEKLLASLNEENKKVNNSSCNRRNKEECPLREKCNIENIVYQANISTKEVKLNSKAYIGSLGIITINNHLITSYSKTKLPYQNATGK